MAPSPPHPFTNSSPPPVQRRTSTLPSSTSESHLARAIRAPQPPKPPAQPTKFRPFILRGSSAPSATADSATDGKENIVSAAGSMRKSKTSGEIAQPAKSTSSSASSRADKERRRASAAVVPGGLRMTNAVGKDGTALDARRRSVSSCGPSAPPSSAEGRPISLAASSLRAITASTSSASSRPKPNPRARPLSYVSSPTSPPTTSPPRRRLTSFSASPSPPSKSRPHASQSAQGSPQPCNSPTRARVLALAASVAVEAHKAELKRRTLAARQNPECSAEGVGAMRRSGRWFGQLANAAEEPAEQADALEDSAPAQAPWPRDVGAETERFLSADARAQLQPPATPTPVPGALRGPAKKASYSSLGRGRAMHVESPPTVVTESDGGAEDAGVGFASLQELLERHGYADTRVITPQAQKVRPAALAAPTQDAGAASRSLRAPSPAPRPPPASVSLAPPEHGQQSGSKGLKERSSLLSLRGWFSLFSPAPESSSEGGDGGDEVEVLVDSVLVGATDSPQPRMRSTSEMARWAEGVAEAYPPLSHAPHPLSHSSLPIASSSSLDSTPQLLQYDARDDEDSASARSYSSSLSLDYSPPTPQHPLPLAHAHSFCPTISISPDGDSPLKPRAGKSSGHSLVLRHAASDSRLLASPSSISLPRYESFSGLGITIPPASPTPSPPATPRRVATPPPTAGMFSSMWVPSLLRERASQLFSLSASSVSSTGGTAAGGTFASPIDAATGLSPSQRRLLTAAHAHIHGPAFGRDRAPKLLRKAVSAGGLRVVAQGRVTHARVETKSSRESLGSLEAAPVVTGGDAMESAWGEDLLGRRW